MTDKNITWDDIPSLEMDDDTPSSCSNKRAHERLSVHGLKKLLPTQPNIIVRLFSPKAGLGLMEGRLLDLSKKGAKINLGKAIPMNEVIEMLIPLDSRKIKCKGMVKWVKQENNTFNIGVEFMDISPMDAGYISDVISTYHLTF